MLPAKSERTTHLKKQLTTKQLLSVSFLLLKRKNRVIKYKTRTRKEVLYNEKVLVNSNRLRLQNMLYEVNHLRREIRRCYALRSYDENIELLDESEYRIALGSDADKPNGGSRMRLLDSECRLRKKQAQYCKELTLLKKEVHNDITVQLQRLSSFAPSLRLILKSALPMQNAFNISTRNKWTRRKIINELPQPLHLIFMNTYALIKSNKLKLSVAIVDSRAQKHRKKGSSHSKLDEKNLKSRYGSISDIKDDITMPHPLNVQISMHGSNPGENLIINMYYFSVLELVTASSKLQCLTRELSTREKIILLNVLEHLYKDDDGNTIPTKAAEEKINELNLNEEDILRNLKSRNFGKPYKWLQWMCSTNVCEVIKNAEYSKPLFSSEILEKLLWTWCSRLSSLNEVNDILRNNSDELSLLKTKYFNNDSSFSFNWTAIPMEESITGSPATHSFYCNLASTENLFYRAVIACSAAKMHCTISIPIKYPSQNPFWILELKMGDEYNSQNNVNVKAMEYFTNSLQDVDLKSSKPLLFLQLLSVIFGLNSYHKEKTGTGNNLLSNNFCLTNFSKRSRSLSYRAIKKIGTDLLRNYLKSTPM